MAWWHGNLLLPLSPTPSTKPAQLHRFKRKDAGLSEPPDDPGNPTVNFHGERGSNATYQSTTDSEAKLAKKGVGKEARLCCSANALMENRHAPVGGLPSRTGL